MRFSSKRFKVVLCWVSCLNTVFCQRALGAIYDDGSFLMEAAFTVAVAEASVDSDNSFEANVVRTSPGDMLEGEQAMCSLLEESNIFALFGPKTKRSILHIQSIADFFEIPQILTEPVETQNRNWSAINLYPHHIAYSQVFADIIAVKGWMEFTIIYEGAELLPFLDNIFGLEDLDLGDHIVMTVVQLPEGDDYRHQLKNIKSSGSLNYLVDCSLERLPQFMQQAQQVGLMSDDHSYIIMNPDFQTIDIDPYKHGGSNITGIRFFDPSLESIQSFITSINAKVSELSEEQIASAVGENALTLDLALIYDAVTLYTTALNILGTTEGANVTCSQDESWNVGSTIINFAKTVEIDGLTGLVKFDEDGFRTDFEIDVLEVMVHGLEKVGTWTAEDGYTEARTIVPPAELEGSESMRGKHFIVLTALSAPYGMLKESPAMLEGNDRYEGFGIELIEELAKMNGFNYTFELQEDGVYGSYDSTTGKWTGMMEKVMDGPRHSEQNKPLFCFERIYMDLFDHTSVTSDVREKAAIDGTRMHILSTAKNLSRHGHSLHRGVVRHLAGDKLSIKAKIDENNKESGKRADFAITDLTITAARQKAVDFTSPFMNLGITILYKKPTKQPPDLFSFISPFSLEVWGWLAGAFVGVSVLLFLLGRIAPEEWQNPYPCIEEPETLDNQFTLANSFWFTLGSVLTQGSEIAPIAVSTRMAGSMWWFFTLIMVSSYTANLAAFLTVESKFYAIKSVADLANNPYDIHYGAKMKGATYSFFKESDNLLYQKMYEYMESHPEYQPSTNDEGLKRVKSDEENYAFLMESTSIEYMAERNCDIAQVGGLLDSKGYGIAMKKNSPYRQPMSESILQLQEQGVLTRMKDKWWKEKRGGGACADDDAGSGDAQPLVLANVGGVFIVLAAGSGMAVVCAILEMIVDVWTISRKQKVSFKDELIAELKFVFSSSGDVKPVRHREPSGSGSGGSKKSKGSKDSGGSNNTKGSNEEEENIIDVESLKDDDEDKQDRAPTPKSERSTHSHHTLHSRRQSNAVQMARMRKYSRNNL